MNVYGIHITDEQIAKALQGIKYPFKAFQLKDEFAKQGIPCAVKYYTGWRRTVFPADRAADRTIQYLRKTGAIQFTSKGWIKSYRDNC